VLRRETLRWRTQLESDRGVRRPEVKSNDVPRERKRYRVGPDDCGVESDRPDPELRPDPPDGRVADPESPSEAPRAHPSEPDRRTEGRLPEDRAHARRGDAAGPGRPSARTVDPAEPPREEPRAPPGCGQTPYPEAPADLEVLPSSRGREDDSGAESARIPPWVGARPAEQNDPLLGAQDDRSCDAHVPGGPPGPIRPIEENGRGYVTCTKFQSGPSS
jgi:hypothetical protein